MMYMGFFFCRGLNHIHALVREEKAMRGESELPL